VVRNKKAIRILASALILIGLGITVYAGLASGGSWLATSAGQVGPIVGAKAPDFTLEVLSGGEINLRDLQGKTVVLNFWATWCAPCVIEMPNLQKYYEKYAGEIEILAVNADEPPKIVQEFIEDIGASFPVLLDPGAAIQDLYRIRGYPTTFFLDTKGIIRAQHIGMLSEAQIKDYLLKVDIGR